MVKEVAVRNTSPKLAAVMLVMTALPLLSLQPVWAQEALWTAKSPFLKGVQIQYDMEPAIPRAARDAEAAANAQKDWRDRESEIAKPIYQN